MAGFKSNIQGTWPSNQQKPRDSAGRFTKDEENLMDAYYQRGRTLRDKLPITSTPQFIQQESDKPVEDLLATHLSRSLQHVERIQNLPKGKPAYLQYYLWY